jgi:hypothetical protein
MGNIKLDMGNTYQRRGRSQKGREGKTLLLKGKKGREVKWRGRWEILPREGDTYRGREIVKGENLEKKERKLYRREI